MKIRYCVLSLLFFVILVGFIFAGSPGTAIRSLPNTYTIGTPIIVSIDVTPLDGTSVWGIDEFFPINWNVVELNCIIVTTGEVCKGVNSVILKSDIQWGFSDGNEMILSYNIIPIDSDKNESIFFGRFTNYTRKDYFDSNILGDSKIQKSPILKQELKTSSINYQISIILIIIIVIIIGMGILLNINN